jgi:hypothetical protein
MADANCDAGTRSNLSFPYSSAKITTDDLMRLAKLALDDFGDLFARRPQTGDLYRDHLLALCLCQGAAEHYASGAHRVKDFDVWGFFRAHRRRPFPPRRVGHADFGPSRFGHHPDDSGYEGRRVDIIGRGISLGRGEDAVAAIRRYLTRGYTRSARLLAQRPVVIIHPAQHIGEMILCDKGSTGRSADCSPVEASASPPR